MELSHLVIESSILSAAIYSGVCWYGAITLGHRVIILVSSHEFCLAHFEPINPCPIGAPITQENQVGSANNVTLAFRHGKHPLFFSHAVHVAAIRFI